MDKFSNDNEIILAVEEYGIILLDFFNMLIRRYQRFAEIREEIGMSLDLETYLDIILVQLRALLCENSNELLKNYTINNWLSIIGDDKSRQKLEELLNIPVPGWNFVRSIDDNTIINKDTNIDGAIRIITSRTICHNDNLTFNREKNSFKWEILNRTYTEGYIYQLKVKMCDPECEYSIDSIVKLLAQILNVEI